MRITATELNKRPGLYLDKASEEPIWVEKTGRPTVVIVPYKRYLELEEAYWGNLAKASEKEEFLSPEESIRFLMKDD